MDSMKKKNLCVQTTAVVMRAVLSVFYYGSGPDFMPGSVPRKKAA